MTVQHRVVVRDRHGCVVECKTFAGRRQALHFADAQLSRRHEVELDVCQPEAGSAQPGPDAGDGDDEQRDGDR
ncbi:MAG: hypothetical protein JXB32_10740 [Deltaproteobacteria bacterium]|nr:hypothetical protein [Deltaproteobacteria bacterium]